MCLAQGLEAATARPDPRYGSVTLARGCLADESDFVLGYEAILHASAVLKRVPGASEVKM